jgi:hypothetical protein
MLTKSNNEVFGKVIADALLSIGENAGADAPEAESYVISIAKAMGRIETSAFNELQRQRRDGT